MLAHHPAQLNANDLTRFTDALRLQSGRSLTVRFVAPDEGDALQSYFRSLSCDSRHRRLMGAASELPAFVKYITLVTTVLERTASRSATTPSSIPTARRS